MFRGHLKIIVALGFFVTLAILGRGAFGKPDPDGRSPEKGPDSGLNPYGPWKSFQKPTDAKLKDNLNSLQYRVTQQEGTEPPFRNTFWDNHNDGIYVDVVSGEPLFSSKDKFDSGTGWPSFTRSLVADNVVLREDVGFGMRRVEVRSTYGDSHLGHLFDDGPAPTGLRYCINSAALRFVAVDDLADEGYGELVALFRPDEAKNAVAPERTETATLAGGCFWGVEDLLRDIPGVVNTEVGYTGGHVVDASYGDIKSRKSGHAEAVQIVFDPDRVSYEEILMFFFRMHDPTTLNRQGNDRGPQYRSAIFAHDDTQREIAERVKSDVEAVGRWKRPIVTEIVSAGSFYVAEDYHQDYLEKNPNGYTCHYLRDWN